MTKIERESLIYFAARSRGRSKPRPKGLSGVGLENFITRGWIERFGRDGVSGEQLYRVISKGIAAYEDMMKKI